MITKLAEQADVLFPSSILQVFPRESQVPPGQLGDPPACPGSVCAKNAYKGDGASQLTPPHSFTTSTFTAAAPSYGTSDLEVLIHVAFSQQTAPVHISDHSSLEPEGQCRRQRKQITPLMSMNWTLSRPQLHLYTL